MEKSTIVILLVTFATILIVKEVAARCNACNDNGIACLSETAFQLCFNGERDTRQDFTCPTGTICTGLQLRCVDETAGGVEPACPNNVICGQCSPDKMFTCTSRNEFVQCNGTERIPGTAGTCPPGLTCDSKQAEICVDGCKLPEVFECN